MIRSKPSVGPKISHNSTKEVIDGTKRILRAFNKEIESRIETGCVEGKYNKKFLFLSPEDAGKTLLELRRKLVFAIRKGMLERKDLEADIVIMAAFIWYGRCSKEQHDRIMNEW